MVKCEACGKKINTNINNNYNALDGVFTHKKCPPSNNDKLSPEDVKAKRELTDEIQRFQMEQSNGIDLTTSQWGTVSRKIKELKDDGYSYQDQLFAFKWYFDKAKGNVFKGYGIIGFIIAVALVEKHKQEEISKVVNDESAMRLSMERKRKAMLGEI